MDLVLIMCVNKAIDLLVMANSMHCSGHVLRREDGHVLRKALAFVVEGQLKPCYLGSTSD